MGVLPISFSEWVKSLSQWGLFFSLAMKQAKVSFFSFVKRDIPNNILSATKEDYGTSGTVKKFDIQDMVARYRFTKMLQSTFRWIFKKHNVQDVWGTNLYNGRKDAMTRRSYRMKTSEGSSRPFLLPTIYSPPSSNIHHSTIPNYTKASEGIRKIWTSNSGLWRRSRSHHGGVSWSSDLIVSML